MSEIVPNQSETLKLQKRGLGLFAAIVLFVVFAPAVVVWVFSLLAH